MWIQLLAVVYKHKIFLAFNKLVMIAAYVRARIKEKEMPKYFWL